MLILMLFLSPQAYSEEIPDKLKTFLKNKFPGISFKIDNSFVINNETFLPLLPQTARTAEKIEIVHVIPDKSSTPKLFWFSNDWVFVKLIKQNDGTRTIIDLKEIPEQYKERFLKSKFPSDIVVPKDFFVKQELASLVGELPVLIRQDGKSESQPSGEQKQMDIQMKGLLYLTSPDTGKIIYLNLGDLSMIYSIQTMGAPWDIAFDKGNKIFFITDFAKDQIYELKLMESSILKSFQLPVMSSPVDIELSGDGSLAFILDSLTSDFSVYKAADSQLFLKTKLPPNPTSFSVLKDVKLIAIACPNTNNLVFLHSDDFSPVGKIPVNDGPEKVISDPLRNLFYVSSRNGNTVSIIDPKSKNMKKTIEVGETPNSLALAPDSRYLYVSNAKSGSISVIDLENETVADTINLPIETQFPGDIKITSDGRWLIVTSETTSTISVIDLNLKKVALKLDVGATTHGAYIVNGDEAWEPKAK